MHVVHNIAFDIAVNHQNESISWEHYYVNFFQDKLVPKMERLFDTWEAKYPNTKCAIDTLDIDITVDSIHLEELQNDIIAQLEDQLLTIDKSGKTTNGSVRATITSVASPFDALVTYLSNGILPGNITVKVFKEWLGNLVEFTTAEKSTLKTLFTTESATIERMMSLLRNDYGKFSNMLQTSQTIKTQYIKFEEVFFQKFLEEICVKLHLTYQKKQAIIWFKSLRINNSIASFSKTLVQLLVPKATIEKKQLIILDENQLSMAVLQAIIQYDLTVPLNIKISKIAKVVATPDVVNPTKKTTKSILVKTVKPETDLEQTNTFNSTKKNSDNQEQLSKTVQQATNDSTNSENKNTTIDEVQKDDVTNAKTSLENHPKNKTTLKNDSETRNLSHDATDEISNLKKSDQKEISRKLTKSATSNLEKTTTKNTEKHSNTTQDEGANNLNTQYKNPSSTIDNNIIEKLAKLNTTTREIPLSTEKAGLILLHPFLGAFLSGAKLVTVENNISDIGKACMLLHYLATENEEVTDVELTLEKICLGIPLGTIINYQTPLTDEDKALCDELLQAVMNHWKVLKNSTSNTLRDMFLKREGHMILNEKSIQLTIERFAQDVLLDKIPWNIGLFQLKWMDKMMYIKW